MEVGDFNRCGLLGETVCLWILWEEGCSLIGVLGRNIASDRPTFVQDVSIVILKLDVL